MQSPGGGDQGEEEASKLADRRSSEIRNIVGAGGDGGGGDSVGAATAGDARTGLGAAVGNGSGSASGLGYRPRMRSMSGLEGNSEKVSLVTGTRLYQLRLCSV